MPKFSCEADASHVYPFVVLMTERHARYGRIMLEYCPFCGVALAEHPWDPKEDCEDSKNRPETLDDKCCKKIPAYPNTSYQPAPPPPP